jgi:hypothetical protein
MTYDLLMYFQKNASKRSEFTGLGTEFALSLSLSLSLLNSPVKNLTFLTKKFGSSRRGGDYA